MMSLVWRSLTPLHSARYQSWRTLAGMRCGLGSGWMYRSALTGTTAAEPPAMGDAGAPKGARSKSAMSATVRSPGNCCSVIWIYRLVVIGAMGMVDGTDTELIMTSWESEWRQAAA